MLSQDDRQRLEEIERQLQADDPRFVKRMRKARRLRRPDTVTIMLLLFWGAALAIAVMAQSVLMIVALAVIIAIEAAWRVYRHYHPQPD